MKIVLVNPPLTSKQRLYRELAAVKINYPPLGLCYLASVLREKGFGVGIVDLQIYEESLKKQARRVLAEKPDFIGVTATSVAINNVAQLAKELKKRTKAPIILGGPHITAVPKKTMEMFPQFDLGVVGEGEETLPEVLTGLTPKDISKVKYLDTFEVERKIPGLVIRVPEKHLGGKAVDEAEEHLGGEVIRLTPPRKPIRDLDSLSLPAFDLLPDFSHYGGSQFIEFDVRPTFRLVTSRGCPFQCTFCDKSVFGKTFRAHSPEYVLKMIKVLYHSYGIRHLYISDDTFTLDKKRVFDICRLLEKEGLDLTWDCNTRVDTVDPPLLKAMKKAGCIYIAYGIETGSQEILDVLNKGTTLGQIRKACDWTVKAGIKIRGNFIMANPGETKETIDQTISFAKSLPLYTFKMSFFTPFPNTEIYDEIGKWGQYQEDWSKLSKYNPVFIPHGLTQRELEKSYKKAYFSFYFRPRIILRYLTQLKNQTALKYALKNFFTLCRFLLANQLKKYQPLITSLISLLLFGLLFSRINIEATLTAAAMMKLNFFALACFLSIGTNFFWITDKWRRILNTLGVKIPYKDLFFVRVGSYAVRGVLPLKSGEVSRIAYLKKFHRVPWKTGTASIIITLILNLLALLIFMIWGVLI